MERSEFFKRAGLGLGLATVMPFIPKDFRQADARASVDPRIVRAPQGRTINVLGDIMTFKLTGEDTDGQYVLIEENNDPGVSIPMHVHEHEDEIFRVLAGELEVQVGDRKAVLGPGDMAFCPRGIPHMWRVVGGEKAKVDLSVFPAGLEVMFEELAELPEGPPDFEQVGRICGRYGVRFV